MLRFAIRNLFSRPMRSLLSLLGLTVAIAGMVGLFSVARGLDRLVSTTFARLHGLAAMQPGAPIPLFSRLPTKWGDEIAAVPGVRLVSPEIWTRVNVINDRMVLTPPRFLFGTDIPSRLALEQGVYRDDIVSGRFLTLADRGTNHALISRQIAEEFHTRVGETLRVNGFDLLIVGIYHCGSMLFDVAIILDIEQVRSMSRFDAESVSTFYIEQTGDVDDAVLLERIRDVFRGRKVEPASFGAGGASLPSSGLVVVDLLIGLERWLRSNPLPDRGGAVEPAVPATINGARMATSAPSPGDAAPTEHHLPGASGTRDDLLKVDDSSPIEIRSAEAWGERITQFAADLDIFLTIITAIGVIVAVLSIVNTMLMSVSERIIDFGILKANGWTKTDVLLLITFESGTLGVAGGLLGSVVGWLATHIINGIWPDRLSLYASPGLLAVSVSFSTALGILGGLYPAFWAMRMMPMDAIRRG